MAAAATAAIVVVVYEKKLTNRCLPPSFPPYLFPPFTYARSTHVCIGDNRVCQFCKSDIQITKGLEYIKLARKGLPPNKNGEKQKQLYMHRFYASCCSHPLYNTVDFLGFVGVFTDLLDTKALQKFDGPVYMFENEAYKDPTKRQDVLHKSIFVPHFIWKLIRYYPYRNCGSTTYLNYNLKDVVYWGG